MRVRCLSNGYWGVTKGRTYRVIDESDRYYTFIDDDGDRAGLRKSSFEVVEEESMEEYKRGQKVLVSVDNENWHERIFLATVEGAECPNICVSPAYEGEFERDEEFGIILWKHIKPLPEEKVITMDEVKEMLVEKFGADVKIKIEGE